MRCFPFVALPKLWTLQWIYLSKRTIVAQTNDAWETGSLRPPENLVSYTNGLNKLCAPRRIVGTAQTLSRAIPTNKWYANILTCADTSPPVWPNPYAVLIDTNEKSHLTATTGLSVSYPARSRVFSDTESNPGASRYFLHGIVKEVQFSAVEFDAAHSPPKVQVVDWTDAGVTVQLRSDEMSTSCMESDIVSGMAYFSVSYEELTPRVSFSAVIRSINGKALSPGSTLQDSRFVIETTNGLRWVLYAVAPVGSNLPPFKVTVCSTGNTLRSDGKYSGTLRVAAIFEQAPVETYDLYADCIVTGGDTDILSDTAYTFTWSTDGPCTKGFLHFAHAHLVSTIDISATSRTKMIPTMMLESSTHGSLTAFVAAANPGIWTMREPGSIPVIFYSKTRPTAAEAASQSLLEKLVNDISATWTIPKGGSYYSNGKLAQKYAQLCLMANDPNIVGKDVTPLRRCLMKLVTVIEPMISNTWTYPLAYDTIYGGIISSQGIALDTIDADYGNTVYNDHHYHNAYWIYTCAVINYLYPTFNKLDDLNKMIKLLIRDVLTPNNADPYFVKYRNYDLTHGHSFSHGITPFFDGKDQESTSEEINLMYAVYLYGTATNNPRMAAISKLLIKVTARALHNYFLMESTNKVQPARFIKNKVTGIFFENKVDYATWFSAEKYCIHGIQMIPLTPITDYVRTTNFIMEEWKEILSLLPIVKNKELGNPWLSLLYANYARVDKVTALEVLSKVALDDGLTRSWAIYMALGQSSNSLNSNDVI